MSNSCCGTVWSRTGTPFRTCWLRSSRRASVVAGSHFKVLPFEYAASEDHEVRHEHFVDDVNDAVISAHVSPCDGRTVDLNAFQQGGCDCVFHDVAVGSLAIFQLLARWCI